VSGHSSSFAIYVLPFCVSSSSFGVRTNAPTAQEGAAQLAQARQLLLGEGDRGRFSRGQQRHFQPVESVERR